MLCRVSDCGHPGADAGRVCRHVQGSAPDLELTVHFTGRGVHRELRCQACAEEPGSNLVEVCRSCLRAFDRTDSGSTVTGLPVVVDRPSSLQAQEETLSLDERGGSPVVAVSVVRSGRGWVALCADGSVGRLDLPRRELRILAKVPEGEMAVGELALAASAEGRFAAVVNERGSTGVVLDLETGAVTMKLDRGQYHPEVSSFPVAFALHLGRTVLIHGTDWNRLDVSDPLTGALLTGRTPTAYRQGDPRPAHYLDYFHGALCVSPGSQWIAEDGWVWQPVGVPVCWSLARWLDGNEWEADDGPSLRSFGYRDFWDYPLCWLAEDELGMWGGNTGMRDSVPLLNRVDVRTGETLDPIACPEGSLAAEEGRLYVFGRATGLSVIDLATGDRLLHRPEITPTAYRGGGEFLTLLPGGSFRVVRVV
jgi:hypothetical protein